MGGFAVITEGYCCEEDKVPEVDEGKGDGEGESCRKKHRAVAGERDSPFFASVAGHREGDIEKVGSFWMRVVCVAHVFF